MKSATPKRPGVENVKTHFQIKHGFEEETGRSISCNGACASQLERCPRKTCNLGHADWKTDSEIHGA